MWRIGKCKEIQRRAGTRGEWREIGNLYYESRWVAKGEATHWLGRPDLGQLGKSNTGADGKGGGARKIFPPAATGPSHLKLPHRALGTSPISGTWELHVVLPL